MIGLYHPVALNFRTSLRLILCCLYKNLTDCIEYCEIRIADLLFITSSLKVLSKWSKYCEKKNQNVRELRTASTMPTDFEGSWADMQRIYLHGFMSFLQSV